MVTLSPLLPGVLQPHLGSKPSSIHEDLQIRVVGAPAVLTAWIECTTFTINHIQGCTFKSSCIVIHTF